MFESNENDVTSAAAPVRKNSAVMPSHVPIPVANEVRAALYLEMQASSATRAVIAPASATGTSLVAKLRTTPAARAMPTSPLAIFVCNVKRRGVTVTRSNGSTMKTASP